MELIICTEKDVGEVTRLIRQMAEGFGVTSPIDDGFVGEYIRTPHSRILLAVDQGQVLGMASFSVRPCLFHRGDAWYIEEVIVDKAARGRGIGTYLLEHIIKMAKKEKCLELSIAVGIENENAIGLYKKMGFEDGSLMLEQHFL